MARCRRGAASFTRIVDPSAGFAPQAIGAAFLKQWALHGAEILPRGADSPECPITLERIKSPVLLSDGSLYEEDAILRWLGEHDTAPCTNLPLQNKKVLRLKPLRRVVEHVLFDSGVGDSTGLGALRTAIDAAIVAPVVSWGTSLHYLEGCMERLAAELSVQKGVLIVAEEAASQLRSKMRVHEKQIVSAQRQWRLHRRRRVVISALRLQTAARVFLARRFVVSIHSLHKVAQASIVDDDAVRPNSSTKYPCEGNLPDGNILKDGTLQLLSDLTPDGRNKELFLCRRCGFVAGHHMWYQARNRNGPLQHFRCRRCFTEYYPWKRDSRLCRFNKVLVNVNPANPDELIATPAWWDEDVEEAFINCVKEVLLKIHSGSIEISEVKYNNITKFVSEKILASYCQSTTFEKVAVPAPLKERICELHECKNYAHCDIKPDEVEGFFFKNHMLVTEDQIFKDVDMLCNEIASCFRVSEPFRRRCW